MDLCLAAREDNVDLSRSTIGTDIFPRILTTLFDQRELKFERYPHYVLPRLRPSAGNCGVA